MRVLLFQVLLSLSASLVSSSIAGWNYMDSLRYEPYKRRLAGEDPCNPLYWYPRSIPEYCYYGSTPKIEIKSPSLPVPTHPNVIPAPYPPPYPALVPIQSQVVSHAPLPYGIHLEPSNPMLPVAVMSHPSPIPYHQHQIGMVPGIPGIVSDDGGINILPFSDAYADVLEKHKLKMIRRKYQEILNDYAEYPWTPRRRKHRFY